jgi:hypothetical protein
MEYGMFIRKLMIRGIAVLLTILNIMLVLRLFTWWVFSISVNDSNMFKINIKGFINFGFQLILELFKALLLVGGKSSVLAPSVQANQLRHVYEPCLNWWGWYLAARQGLWVALSLLSFGADSEISWLWVELCELRE